MYHLPEVSPKCIAIASIVDLSPPELGKYTYAVNVKELELVCQLTSLVWRNGSGNDLCAKNGDF